MRRWPLLHPDLGRDTTGRPSLRPVHPPPHGHVVRQPAEVDHGCLAMVSAAHSRESGRSGCRGKKNGPPEPVHEVVAEGDTASGSFKAEMTSERSTPGRGPCSCSASSGTWRSTLLPTRITGVSRLLTRRYRLSSSLGGRRRSTTHSTASTSSTAPRTARCIPDQGPTCDPGGSPACLRTRAGGRPAYTPRTPRRVGLGVMATFTPSMVLSSVDFLRWACPLWPRSRNGCSRPHRRRAVLVVLGRFVTLGYPLWVRRHRRKWGRGDCVQAVRRRTRVHVSRSSAGSRRRSAR